MSPPEWWAAWDEWLLANGAKKRITDSEAREMQDAIEAERARERQQAARNA